MKRPVLLDFDKLVAPVGGYLTENEGNFLYESAKRVKPPSVVVEIGSWKGRSAICLGKGAADGNKATVYAIDPHRGSRDHVKYKEDNTLPEFKENIKRAGLEEQVFTVRATSEEASRSFNKPVGFIFIDGDHGYRPVNLDYQLWFPKLVDGGIITFHDCRGILGPHLLTAKLLLLSSEIKDPKIIDTLNSFTKVSHNSTLNRVDNMSFLPYRFLVGIFGKIKAADAGSMQS